MANYTSKIVSAGSTWQLGAGDTAKYTSVYGAYSLSNGAIDSSATVFSGGAEMVSSGGTAFNATISGTLNVYSSGTVSGVVLADGGWAGVSDGGKAAGATVSSGALFNVYSGGSLSGADVLSSGRLSVRTGAAAQNVTLRQGAIVGQFTQSTGIGSISQLSGAEIRGTAAGLNGAGRLNIGQGGTLSNAVLLSGSIDVSSGGLASHVDMSGGMTVLSGGTAADLTMQAGAALAVNDGGIASDVTVQQGGSVALFRQIGAGAAQVQKMSGGQAAGIVTGLDYVGALYAGSGASLTNVAVNSGLMLLNSAASASGIAARSAGEIVVNSGATVTAVTVSSGGSMNFAENATATAVTVKSGGTVRAFTQTGATDAYLGKITGGTITGVASRLDFTGSVDVGLSGSALAAVVEDSGALNVLSGGTAFGVSLSSGGTLNAGSAAHVSNVSIASGAQVNVEDGAVLRGLVQSSGGNVNVIVKKDGQALVSGANASNMFTLSGGTASNFVIYKDGRMVVSSGASASGILIQSGGVMSASIAAEVTGSSVDMGIGFSISNGVRSGLNTLSNFVLMVDSGYQINGQVLRGGGVQQVGFCGTVDSTTVSSGGMLEVTYGASATNVTMKNGGRIGLDVYGIAAGTLVSGTYVDSGSRTFSLEDGVASGFDLTSGSWMTVHSGGQASKTKVLDGAKLVISSGGKAMSVAQAAGAAIEASVRGGDNATVISGSRTEDGRSFRLANGNASSFLLENGGLLHVYSDGIASNTIVRLDGSMIVGFGGSAVMAEVAGGGSFVADSASFVSGITVASGADVVFSGGARLEGNIVLGDSVTLAGEVSADTATVDLNVSVRTTADPAFVVNPGAFSGADFQVTVAADQKSGQYKLAEGAAGFDKAVTIRTTTGAYGTLTVGSTVELANQYYTLNLANSLLSLTVSNSVPEPEGPKVNLLENGVSQILAWDEEQGKVGFMATDGNPAPAWHGVWEWPTEYNPDLGTSEAALWKVVAAGRFSGSTVEHDGILLYNGIGNTFAAWTNLNDPSYGYVSLCHVDDNFETKCLGDFDANGFDDVVIYNEKGSVGIVSDAASYHDVWHVDDSEGNPWELLGAGTFDTALGQDSLLFRNTFNGHLYLWDNQGSDLASWNWQQTDIGYLADGWEFAAIGDFAGDGTDDIVLVNHNDSNAVFIWDDGVQSSQHYVGVLGSGFEIETVGDYNGDGKDDLLLREYNTGWGGLGYWASGEASAWTDLNARIETDMESKFAIIA